MPYFQYNSLSLYYEVKGKGKPLILLAGLARDLSHWMFIERQLCEHFQLILIDNRGAGRSDIPKYDYQVADMATDVEQLCERLDIGPAYVLGHSLGGAIAQNLAHLFPHRVKKLILSHSFSCFPARSMMVLQLIEDMLKQNRSWRDLMLIQLPWFYSNYYLQKPGIVDLIIHSTEKYPYRQGMMAYSQQVRAISQFDSRAWLNQIHIPTLVLAGEEDYLTPKEHLQTVTLALPEAQMTILPRAHLPMLETPDSYVRYILDFFS